MNSEVNFNSSSEISQELAEKYEHNMALPIHRLPREILDMIFNEHLSDRGREEAARVCRHWCEIVYERRPYGIPVTIFCENVWKESFGYQIEGDIPKPPSREEVFLTRDLLNGREGAPRCMLALIPKGLTFNILRPLMEKPQKGPATPIRYIWYEIVQELGDKSVDQTCWVLFTESVIEGTRGKSLEAQKKLIEEKTNGQCALPELIVAVACVALKHVTTEKRILGDNPWTYTRCKELVYGKWLFVVGGFSSGGLYVGRNYDAHDFDGAVGCRKFK